MIYSEVLVALTRRHSEKGPLHWLTCALCTRTDLVGLLSYEGLRISLGSAVHNL